MKKIIYSFILIVSLQFLNAQVIYEPFESSKLGETREIKIQLPRNYDPEDKFEYPLIIVLDGDYLFEPMIGNVDYQSYWGEMPKCVVVGINQSSSREDDFFYDKEIYFPAHNGALFFEFLGKELIPYIESMYNVSEFRIVVGHDLSANFLNFYLFKTLPLFRAYVSFSPELAPEMQNRLHERLSDVTTDMFYYLATAENDVKKLHNSISELNTSLSTIDNPLFHYRYDNFEDTNHYSLVGLGIPKAMNQIFELYKPININEYKEKVLIYPEGPYKYLEKKYKDIEGFYGFKKKVVENDLRAIASASKKIGDMESLRELSKLAKKEYPNSMISAYYQGLYHEYNGNIKKAINYYQSGLLLDESDYIEKDDLLDKIYELKE